MKKWLVTYTVEIDVEAETEDEAIDIAVETWTDGPDGDWTAEEYPVA